jgi:hypothetical protein
MRGGWQLEVFDSGPSEGTAVVLSQLEQVVIYVDLTTMTETRRVNLPTDLQSFRLGKNDNDGSVVVAFADPLDGLTKANDTTTTQYLNNTVPFLATGFRLSTDGTQIYWGNRGSFTITPNQ